MKKTINQAIKETQLINGYEIQECDRMGYLFVILENEQTICLTPYFDDAKEIFAEIFDEDGNDFELMDFEDKWHSKSDVDKIVEQWQTYMFLAIEKYKVLKIKEN